MGNQNEITEASELFTKDGSLLQRGWARKPILTYNKEYIGKRWTRIKEWDHFSILNNSHNNSSLEVYQLNNDRFIRFNSEVFLSFYQ